MFRNVKTTFEANREGNNRLCAEFAENLSARNDGKIEILLGHFDSYTDR